jgi:hypothetical protein
VMAEMLVVKHQMMVSNRSFEDYGWGAHCRGLVELPVAAGPAIREGQASRGFTPLASRVN